jgi:hypothetical protein
MNRVTNDMICIYIYCSEKYNIMKVKLSCVFKCIYKHYILLLVTYMHTGSAYDCGNKV